MEEVVRKLHDVATAIDAARALGLDVRVPERLYEACMEIVTRREVSLGEREPDEAFARDGEAIMAGGAAVSSSSGGGSGATTSVGAVRARDVPLRRLVWQVIDPGERFTVSDVANRLSALGVEWPTHKVSNALGYWVSRGRLARQRKGLYHYPVKAGADVQSDHGTGRPSPPVRIQDRADAARGEERTIGPQHRATKAS
ncbi:hypothetical protein O7627_32490 [Solwaraspora sp. WMMD1047]|uniref:hypothetical protein n=1 Tax=Solwaraspora sp. WMMD1047 TaxID=3016102 RepID=UPI002417175B|nr:hypothetical protein [Solwaraspora sp. WMMD1047]MDG4833991.1 hypothetical protein [Solwaraspora sp. WMMD1047]